MIPRGLALLLMTLAIVSCDNVREFRGEKVREFAVQHYMMGDFEKAMDASEAAINLGSADASTYLVRGFIFSNDREFENALEATNTGLEKVDDPAFAGSDDWLGEELNVQERLRFLKVFLLRNLGNPVEAAAEMQRLIEENPDEPEYYNDLAWSLATDPNAAYRDGVRAVALGTKANELTEWKVPALLDTLAAAYAVNGDFENAVKFQKQAVEALDNGEFDPDFREDIMSRVALFERGEIYIEDPTEEP